MNNCESSCEPDSGTREVELRQRIEQEMCQPSDFLAGHRGSVFCLFAHALWFRPSMWPRRVCGRSAMNHPCAHQIHPHESPSNGIRVCESHLSAIMAIMANQLDFHHCSLLRKRVQHREEALVQFLEGDFFRIFFWLTNVAFKLVGPQLWSVNGPLGQGVYCINRLKLWGFHQFLHRLFPTSSIHNAPSNQ